MSIRDLQCVVTLAETLNFTETAERLYMTQPGVTARISRVERIHGYRLFDRTKGLVRALTPVGFVFVEEARKVLEQLHLLIGRSDAAHRAFSETLSVGRSHHADLELLSIVVQAQAIEGTHIVIAPPCNSDKEAIALLVNGKADAVLIGWPVSENHVTALRLTRDSMMVVLPRDHRLRDRAEIHLSDLRNETIIGSTYQFPESFKKDFNAKCHAAGFDPEWVYISASPAESIHLVDTNARPGVTLVTKRYAEEISLANATCAPLADSEITYEYDVAYRQADNRMVLNVFLQYLVERCRPAQGRRRKPSASLR